MVGGHLPRRRVDVYPFQRLYRPALALEASRIDHRFKDEAGSLSIELFHPRIVDVRCDPVTACIGGDIPTEVKRFEPHPLLDFLPGQVGEPRDLVDDVSKGYWDPRSHGSIPLRIPLVRSSDRL